MPSVTDDLLLQIRDKLKAKYPDVSYTLNPKLGRSVTNDLLIEIVYLIDGLSAPVEVTPLVLSTNIEADKLDNAKASAAKAVYDFVSTKVAALVNSSPAALDTLKELADAIGDDPNFATTILNALAGKLSTTDHVSADLVDETASKKFLSNNAQTIAGTKTFSNAITIAGFTSKASGALQVDTSPSVAPELWFKGYRQQWLMGIDVANNGGGGDFVMLGIGNYNGSVGDLIYVNANKTGTNLISDQSADPTIGFFYTPASPTKQTVFSGSTNSPTRSVVGIRKGPVQSGKLLDFFDSNLTSQLWVNPDFSIQAVGQIAFASDITLGANTLHLGAGSNSGADMLLKSNYSPGTGYYFTLSGGSGELFRIQENGVGKFTSQNIQLQSGNASNYSYFSVGRTTEELILSVAGAAGQGFSNTSQGSAIIKNGGGGHLYLGTGSGSSTLILSNANTAVFNGTVIQQSDAIKITPTTSVPAYLYLQDGQSGNTGWEVGVGNTGAGIAVGDFYIRRTGNFNLLAGDKTTGALTFNSSIKTGAPTSGTAAAWKLGSKVDATVALDTTKYIQLDVGGTLYKLAIVS